MIDDGNSADTGLDHLSVISHAAPAEPVGSNTFPLPIRFMSTALNASAKLDVAATLNEGCRLLAEDPRGAAEQARRVLAAAPASADAYRLLGRALRLLGRDDEANEAELSAIRMAEHDAELQRAMQAWYAQDLAATEIILRQILHRRPDDVVAIRMLAEIAEEVGLLGEAERLLRQALQLAPGFDYARLHLAATLHRQDRWGEALAELDKITGELRDFEETRDIRASVLSRLADYDEAIAIFRSRIAEEAGNVEPLIGLAHALQAVGATEEAVSLFRKAIEISPALGEPWWDLANLKTYRFSDEEIAAMQGKLAAAGLSDEDRAHLNFALGKAFEDRGEYKESFGQYEQGNRARRSRHPHDPSAVRSYVEACKKLFAPEFVTSRADSGCRAPDPIFIIGMPRAGSTLIEQILASHPAVEGTAELPYINGLAKSLEPGELELARGAPHLYPQILSELPSEELRRLGELYLERSRVHRKTDRPFFTDKMPSNWRQVGFIKLILPNAKIIDARRHPLACCFSNFKQLYGKGLEFSYDLQDLGRYYSEYIDLMRHFDRVIPGTIHRVIHERLVTDPENEVRRLLDYLGLPFVEACLSFYESKRPVRTASSEQVRRPLSRESTEQWRRFDVFLGPLKSALGPALEEWAR